MGYTDAVYGQAGLEASLDDYLRGLQGNPPEMVWANHMLYGQPPPGLDIRTSLDLDLQANADRLLQGYQGALVLLNANTGEILAMASHPTFNANRLTELGESLIQNPDAPLLNRAAQGLYPTGAALGALLLAQNWDAQNIPLPSGARSVRLGDQTYHCANLPEQSDWPTVITVGCPQPVVELGKQMGAAAVTEFFTSLGLYSAPQVYLPANSSPPPEAGDPASLALGAGTSVSPLQMSLAAAALSSGGIRPAPYLVMAVNEPQRGWVILPTLEEAKRLLPERAAQETATALTAAGQPFWQSLAVAPESDHSVTWFLGGTLPEWNGTPLALAVLLEEDNPDLAEQIGQKMLLEAMGK